MVCLTIVDRCRYPAKSVAYDVSVPREPIPAMSKRSKLDKLCPNRLLFFPTILALRMLPYNER